MPITLSCPCGKTLRVGDEHAGKRVKCPACTAVLTAPKPEADREVVEEAPARPLVAQPAAKPMPKEEEDERGSYGMQPAEKTAPVPRPKPEFRKRATDDEDDEDTDDEPRRAAAGLSRASARRSAEKSAQRGVYTVGGALATVVGVGFAVWGNNGEGRGATKLLVAGVIIALFGIVSLIQGITGNLPDDEE